MARGLPWVRVSTEIAMDGEIELVSDAAFRTYIEIISLSGLYLLDGRVPMRIVHKQCNTADVDRAIQELMDAGYIEIVGDEVVIPKYERWQETAKRVNEKRRRTAERVRKHRTDEESNAVTDSVTDSVTGAATDAKRTPLPLVQSTEYREESTEKRVQTTEEELSSASAAGEPDISGFVDDFHRLCPSLPAVRKFEKPRQKRALRLVKELGYQGVLAFFGRVEASDFLTGRAGKWKADFDWILKPEHVNRILEGSYDNRGSPTKSQTNVARALAIVESCETDEEVARVSG
jgi:hypothetical protein